MLPLCDVFGPGGDGLVEGLIPVVGGGDPPMIGVPGDSLFDAAGAKLGQDGPFCLVGLAHVLG
jgi:hypothetical protein